MDITGHEYDGPVQILPDQILWEWETKMADRIALVDDDQNILTSVSLTLESEGFDVDCYHDGEAALVGLARRVKINCDDLLAMDMIGPV